MEQLIAADEGQQAVRTGFWLRMARERAGMSQTKAVQALGRGATSASSLIGYEGGQRIPALGRLQEMAAVYGVPLRLFTDPPPTAIEQIDFLVAHPDTGYIAFEAKTPLPPTAVGSELRFVMNALINLVEQLPDKGAAYADLVEKLNEAVRGDERERVSRLVREAMASPDPAGAMSRLITDEKVTVQQLIDYDLIGVRREATDTTSVSDSISHSIGRAADR